MISLPQKKFFSRGRFFLKSSLRGVRNEDGQGVIEYLLILIVVVSIIIGVISQFNRAFGYFVESYMGGYVSCLLETGELPNLGSEQRAEAICDIEYEPFSLANGRPEVEGTAGDGKAGAGAGASQGSRRGQRKSGRVTAGRGGGANGISGINDGGSGSASERNKNGQAKRVKAGGGEGGDKFFSANTGQSLVQRKKHRRIKAMAGEFFSDQQKKKKKEEEKRVVAQTEEEESGSKPKRVPLNISKKEKKIEEKEEGFSFGYLIKLLIIIVVALGVIIFVGNQALSIIKGAEK